MRSCEATDYDNTEPVISFHVRGGTLQLFESGPVQCRYVIICFGMENGIVSSFLHRKRSHVFGKSLTLMRGLQTLYPMPMEKRKEKECLLFRLLGQKRGRGPLENFKAKRILLPEWSRDGVKSWTLHNFFLHALPPLHSSPFLHLGLPANNGASNEICSICGAPNQRTLGRKTRQQATRGCYARESTSHIPTHQTRLKSMSFAS